MSTPADQPRPIRCPVCRKPSVDAHAPFCSAACRDRDLIAWLDERYVVPGPPADSEGDGGQTPQ
jgi:endogenous inhibitor of DNA gyrase (YacG/DUF329 family)